MFKMMLYGWVELTSLGNWRLYSEPTIECVDYFGFISKRHGRYYAYDGEWWFLVGNTARQALEQLYRLNDYNHNERSNYVDRG